MSHAFSSQAQEAALGYLYQVQCALWLLLKKGQDDPELQLFFEKLDDISFDEDGTPKELLQTKHRIDRPASLSDTSPDIWKTLRTWSEASLKREIQESTTLTLMTTVHAPENSAASMLRPDTFGSRNIEKALARLCSTAKQSTNATNKAAYELFLKLSSQEQRLLLSHVYVLDGSPNILEVEQKIVNCLRCSTGDNHLSALCDHVEGWWLKKIIGHLLEKSASPIAYNDLRLVIVNSLALFQPDSLPDDPNDFITVTDQEALHDERPFVQQLCLIKCKLPSLRRAIGDYYYAAARRSHWVREGFLLDKELEGYETRLCREWERLYEAMYDELENISTEEELQKAGRVFLHKIEDMMVYSPFFIRPHFNSVYLARGSLHMLANSIAIGWHIDFRLYFQHLLP